MGAVESLTYMCRDCNPLDETELKSEQMQSLSNPLLQWSKNWTNNKNATIAIIGAGPSGIHMASLLLKKGYKNVTIFEKNAQYAENENDTWNERGKSVTIRDDEFNCVHEMGTCYLSPKYDEIEKLLQQYDPENTLIPYNKTERRLAVPKQPKNTKENILSKFNKNDEKTNDKKYKTNKEYKLLTWSEWADSEQEMLIIPEILQWLPDKLSALSAFAAAKKYIDLHAEIFGDYQDDDRINGHYFSDSLQFPPKPKNMEDINMTFLQWILQNNLEAIIPNFIYSQSIQGYGILDELPALYGLWWNSKSLLEVGIDFERIVKNQSIMFVLKKGFYSLWNAIVQKHKMNILYNCKITNVDRHLKDTNRCIEIEYTQNGKDKIMECDVMFIACDLPVFMQCLDTTDEEYEIFNKLDAYTLVSTLYEQDIDNELYDTNGSVVLYPDVLLKRDGSLYAYRNSSLVMNKQENYVKMLKKNGLTRERMVGYQFVNKAPLHFTDNDSEMYKSILLRDLKKYGKKNAKILYQNVTRYFFRWRQEEINKGYPWKVKNEMQGKYKNTYYIGSSVCFEAVEAVVEYNIELLKKKKYR
eukprot:113781_1